MAQWINSPTFKRILDIVEGIANTLDYANVSDSLLDSTLQDLKADLTVNKFQDPQFVLNGLERYASVINGRILKTSVGPVIESQLMRLTLELRGLIEEFEREVQPTVQFSPPDPPEQQIAPYQFGTSAGRLVVMPIMSPPLDGHEKLVASSLEALQGLIADLLPEIEQSNFDPRLRKAVATLSQMISEGTDIIRIGVANDHLSSVLASCLDELPNSLGGSLRGVVGGVQRHAAQFPDWRAYSEAAFSVPIAPEQVEGLVSLKQHIVEAIHDRTDVDIGVVDALDQVERWVQETSVSSALRKKGLHATLLNILKWAYAELALGPLKDVGSRVRTAISVVILSAGIQYGAALIGLPEGHWWALAIAVFTKEITDQTKDD